MPSKASHKTKGGDKDFAEKITFNPPSRTGRQKRGSQTGGTEEQDPKRRLGQFGGAGEPPVMKK